MKTLIILSETGKQGAVGVVKLEGADNREITCNISAQMKDGLKLLLKSSTLQVYDIKEGKQAFRAEAPLRGNVDCLVTDTNGKVLLFGSNTGDKIRCFSLADEYRKRLAQDVMDEIVAPVEQTAPLEEENTTEEPIILPDVGALSDEKRAAPSFVLDDGTLYTGNNFYLAVKPQLDEMFICYPEEKPLMDAIPNSKWVRVNAGNDFYVVGVLYDLDEPTYICYGINGNFSQKPPADIADICEWLPLDISNHRGDGYWIIYQSAETGKTVRLNT